MDNLTDRLLDPETFEAALVDLYLFSKDSLVLVDVARELHARLRTAKADDLECDGTDAAHPAWWRGNDRGCDATVEVLERVLATGKCGNYGSPKLTAALRKVAGLIAALTTTKAEGAAEAYEAEAREWDEKAALLEGSAHNWTRRHFDERGQEARQRAAAIRKGLSAQPHAPEVAYDLE